MNLWMKRLACHYESARRRHPADRLMIVFDMDGTILDMRHMIFRVLREFDRRHGTRFFEDLQVADIRVHENDLEKLLLQRMAPGTVMAQILEWYHNYRWSSEGLLASHRPFAGVMEVIRWFQMQPGTTVGLNTGRPEILRADTLRSINQLGSEYRVRFSGSQLFMNPAPRQETVLPAKVAGIRHFTSAGYRVIAMVDNEPENLRAIAEACPNDDLLLLHADTLFQSRRRQLPRSTVSGKVYDITALVAPEALPRHIQFVWRGVNDAANLRQFLAADVAWAECDVRRHPRDKPWCCTTTPWTAAGRERPRPSLRWGTC